MASSTTFVATPNAGAYPSHGTLSALANTIYPKGTIVQQDANGRAVSPVTSDASGLPALGVAMMTYNNLTGSEFGGANDAFDVELDYGVFGFAFTGTQPKPGDKLYVVDNQTVSVSDNGGTRGFAGICTEVRALVIGGSLKAFTHMGPSVPGVTNVAGESAARSAVNILGALLVSTGAPMAVFADSAANPSVPGVQLTNSKIDSVRWNNAATTTAFVQSMFLGAPSDPAAPATLHLLVSKIGATLADATTFTVQAFQDVVGGLNDAATDIGGTTTAVVGNAATKTIQEVTVQLTGANLVDGASVLSVSIKPTDGTLGTDDICLHAAYLTR